MNKGLVLFFGINFIRFFWKKKRTNKGRVFAFNVKKREWTIFFLIGLLFQASVCATIYKHSIILRNSFESNGVVFVVLYFFICNFRFRTNKGLVFFFGIKIVSYLKEKNPTFIHPFGVVILILSKMIIWILGPINFLFLFLRFFPGVGQEKTQGSFECTEP